MPFTIKCKQCGVDFLADRRNRVFCSSACRGLSQQNRSEKTCDCCGKKFIAIASQRSKSTHVFCSRECYTSKPFEPIESRFWSKVNKNTETGCWLWTGAIDAKRGYGKFATWPTTRNAHSVSYELAHGSIPDGKQVNHTCDVRSCVNPDHLYAGTAKENTNDMRNRGRAKFGELHHSAKLTKEDVKEIRSSAKTPKQLAERFRVTADHITGILRGEKWKDV